MRAMRSLSFAASALALIFLSSAGAEPPSAQYASLRTEGANGRTGPGLEHRIDWISERAGLPLLVIAQDGPWRRVRDPDGAEVWMHAQNLEPRRTGYVRQAVELRGRPRTGAAVRAHLEPGVIGALTGCEDGWARFAIGGRVGWVPAPTLWGAEDCAAG
jgi:SH3-like domain-containing protein